MEFAPRPAADTVMLSATLAVVDETPLPWSVCPSTAISRTVSPS
jgi:hypothetical protein